MPVDRNARDEVTKEVVARKIPFLRFKLSSHAQMRIAERVGGSSEDFLDVLNAGRAIQLNDSTKHFESRGYYLLMSMPSMELFVAITRPSMRTGHVGTVVSIITRKQYESDGRVIDNAMTLRAAKLALSAGEYEHYKKGMKRTGVMSPGWRREDLKVAIHGWDSNNRLCRRVIGSPPIPIAFVREVGLHQLSLHPRFQPWLSQRIAASAGHQALKLERIEAYLGDLEPVELDLARQ